jgi:hypothetical protein
MLWSLRFERDHTYQPTAAGCQFLLVSAFQRPRHFTHIYSDLTFPEHHPSCYLLQRLVQLNPRNMPSFQGVEVTIVTEPGSKKLPEFALSNSQQAQKSSPRISVYVPSEPGSSPTNRVFYALVSNTWT